MGLYTFITGELLYDSDLTTLFTALFLAKEATSADPFVSKSRHCSYLKSKTYFPPLRKI